MATQADTHPIIDRALSEDRARYLDLFAERLFARQPTTLTERLSAETRRAIAGQAFEFFYQRSEPLKLQVSGSADGEAVVTVLNVMEDCPFIVDSVLEFCHSLGAPVRMLLHPVFSIARDENGRIKSFERMRAGERRESLLHLEIELAAGSDQLAAMETELREVLEEVRRVTGDRERMTARALEICQETSGLREMVEVRDFLRWLVQGGFVFLGYRRYRVVAPEHGVAMMEADVASALGILRGARSRFAPPQPVRKLDLEQRKLLFDGPVLIVGKTRRQSLVHRRRAMDNIAIRRISPGGEISFDRFLGLFSSKAYSEEAEHIPVLRAKLGELIEAEHALPGSHDFKELIAAFNSLPKEELFRASIAELREQLDLILDVKNESAVRLSLLSDPERGVVGALVLLPRERFSAEVRIKIQELLAARLGGKLIYYHLAIGEGYTARLHFSFDAPPFRPALLPALEAEVQKLARTWSDRLQEALTERWGAQRGNNLGRRWSHSFSADYQASTSVDRAVTDIERLEELLGGGGTRVEVRAAGDAAEGISELRMYELGVAPILSELMPLLQNFGLQVISEDAHELRPDTGAGKLQAAFVQSFRVKSLKHETVANAAGAARIAEALASVLGGRAENDPLNALTVSADLSWREAALLRAYLAAGFQMRLAPARPALDRVLLLHPELARILIDLFTARLDPDHDAAPGEIERLRADYLEKLAGVDNIADDRIARTVLSMVEATVRCNYFRAPAAASPYFALKFECAKILNLSDLAPLYEIHVSSPRMEGCHLRAGKIARGGIRFSDRPDDFRTEILELMKTQTVKNAIIVPVGSKGGFIVKPRGAAPITHQEVVDAYRTLIGAMLELTDNLVEGRVVHPERVRVLDGDDPYLVVAADKGTAAFSDIANEIAARHQFWLGDAFASGGEHGYDHKALGITARGAWESVKRHLREMGRDPHRGAPITTVGIGDMSGDVFGNGLLQSDNLKLIAAFDHRHIFIDPNPDPAASFAERRRLFKLPNSQWSDYDPALISRGGGVYKRGLKRIELSPEARTALRCDADALDSDGLIRAILRADADLLYNGGIGTYVRAADESDAQAADHANDACRITARELRVKIVAEGGNLGFTQRARIEYALLGGRINTDAIDNSAGVDCSDHEVNLKILMQPAVARGALSQEERNRLLAAASGEVADSVVRDNRDQVLALSLEQIRSRTEADTYREHLSAIEQRGLLRAHEEALPSAEALRERRAVFAGLTRPELAVTTAYTKIDLVAQLVKSNLVDDPFLIESFVRPYFPAEIAARCADEIPRHRLRRELAATRMVNELVDLMGSIFVLRVVRDNGVEAEDAVRAWTIAAGLLDLRAWTERLHDAAQALMAEAELAAFFALAQAARRASAWALINREAASSMSETVARFKPAFDSLAGSFEDFLVDAERERFEQVYRDLRTAVHEERLAHDLTRLEFADHLLNILSLSIERRLPATTVAQAYFRLSGEINFATLEAALGAVDGDRWERRAAQELTMELGAARIEFCCRALDAADGDAAIKKLQEGRPREFSALEHLLAEVRTMPRIGVPALQVAVRAISRLARAEPEN
ncbi:MAG TPA: NAD-glutamate dehydrogenase domain-containing protein [Candidatus Binataceae bacterium]|nr:NAD-glutamate dehydrogenase domain-containing protein [Candidatus Binataceae bacterium]